MKARKVIVLHGLYMNSTFMIPLCSMMEGYGYTTYSANYSTLSKSLAENAADLLPALQKFKQDDEVDFIAHSLGGLLVRHLRQLWPEGFVGSRVVTLGSPHQGSSLAQKTRVFFPAFLLGSSWDYGLDGLLPQWDSAVPLLSIAGTRAIGIGSMCGLLDCSKASDGVVLVEETVIEGMQAHQTIAKTHLELILSPAVARMCHQFLEKLPREAA